MGKPLFDVISFLSDEKKIESDFKNRKKCIDEIRKIIKGDIKAIEIEKQSLYLTLHDGRRYHWRMNTEDDNNFTVLTHVGEYEQKTQKVIEKFVKPDSVILDIGANKGWYSVLFGKLAKDGRVYAIEPTAVAYEELLRNIKINDLLNVHAYNLAVSSYSGSGKMVIPYNHSPLAYLDNNLEGEQVNVTTVDDFVEKEGITQIDLLKIDAEGSEYSILLGARNLLTRADSPTIFIEAFDKCLMRFGVNTNMIITFLIECGYRVFDVETNKECYVDNSEEFDTDLVCIKGIQGEKANLIRKVKHIL